jgi:hypothetical protein
MNNEDEERKLAPFKGKTDGAFSLFTLFSLSLIILLFPHIFPYFWSTT